MKIVLFGEDIFTATVLQSLIAGNHTISAVISPLYKESMEHKGLEQTANRNNIPFLHVKNVNSREIKEQLIVINPELIISVHLKVILLKEIYSLSERGAINIHPSLLPKYRGLSPQHQALIHGDKVTGVTIHFIDEKPDTGDIILQEKIHLNESTSIYDLQINLLSIYKYLVSQAVELIERNKLSRIKQDSTEGSWYGHLRRSDMEIDIGKTKFEIYNLIRAVSKPYGGAHHKGLTIWSSVVPNKSIEKKLMEEYPHTGIYRDGDHLIIRLFDGVLQSDDFENFVH